MDPFKLVVVSAGLSLPSSTWLLADRLADATMRSLTDGERDVAIQVIELRDLATDIAGNLVAGFPGRPLSEALDAVTEADGLIAVTPVFSASYSGMFKSFFDVLDNEALIGKPVVVAATGGSTRHSLALEPGHRRSHVPGRPGRQGTGRADAWPPGRRLSFRRRRHTVRAAAHGAPTGLRPGLARASVPACASWATLRSHARRGVVSVQGDAPLQSQVT